MRTYTTHDFNKESARSEQDTRDYYGLDTKKVAPLQDDLSSITRRDQENQATRSAKHSMKKPE